MFKSWSTEALHGYVVMLDQFVSASHEEIGPRYVEKLELAKNALAERAREAEGKKSSVIFREVVKKDDNTVEIKENVKE